MTNKDRLLGRSRAGERLSAAELAALDKPPTAAPKPKGRTERVNVKASGITWRRKPRRPRRRGSPGRTAPGRHTVLLLAAVLSYRQANRPPGGDDHGEARDFDLECGPGRDGPAGSWMQSGIGLPYVPAASLPA